MLNNLPQALTSLSQWVVVGADSKIPLDAKTGQAASSTNSDTWNDFETARKVVEDGLASYVGFVFADNDIVGVDLDAGYDEEGFITPIAADILSVCESYTERSKSGRGFHVFLKGNLPFKGKNNLNGIEIYRSARYFIMTGDVLIYRDMIENQAAIDYVVEKYFPEELRSKDGKTFNNRIYTPIWEKPQNNRIRLRPVYPRITPGSRNICLTSLAGLLHNQGYSKEQIFDELLYANKTACEPMLGEYEIRTIVNSVTRYKR